MCGTKRIPKTYNKLGRPKKTDSRPVMTKDQVHEHKRSGMSMRAMAYFHGITSAQACRIANA